METFQEKESKYGKIFKVSGPCKPHQNLNLRSGCGREDVWSQDVRIGKLLMVKP